MQEDGENSGRRPSLRELEVLRTLITHGKTTAAAAKLGISQPAVSRAIHQLEQRTGLVLFRREGGRLLPTAEALALHQESEPIFQTLERLERSRWRPEEAHAALRICAPPTLAHLFLHRLLADFSRAEPDVRIYLEIRSGLDVVSMVANGDMDLGVVDVGQEHSGVRLIAFRSSEAHAVVPAGSPLFGREVLEPRDFDRVPFVALARRFPSRTMLERLFRGAGVTPEIVIEVSTAVAAYEFAREGVGIAIINPFPLSLRQDDAVAFRRFRPLIAYETSFVLPSMSPPTPVARRFVDFLRARQPDDRFSEALRAA
jgi:DNA-binding transcriptional LysR family regulator